MRSTFAWREPDVGRRLATVRRTYSWELPRAPVSPDEGARAAAVCGTPAHERASEPTVDVRDAGVQLHDPSAIVAEGGRYFLYSTSYAHADAHGNGAAIKAWMSCGDLERWLDIGHVLARIPPWVRQLVPLNQGLMWAPSVARFGRKWNLYYSVAAPRGPYQDAAACIGVLTSTELWPGAADYGWTDRGPVVCSNGTGTDWLHRRGDGYCAIDPEVVRVPAGGGGDGDDDGGVSGSAWLSFGSHMGGIKLIPLAADGLPLRGAKPMDRPVPSRVYSLATHVSRGNGRVYPWLTAFGVNAIEASYIHHAGGWFYLYANWDMCCIGAGATYNIRVGRSRQITGPYLDAAGKDMELGGGTLVIGAKDAHGNSASGHAGVLELRHASNRSDRRLVLSSHYYLAHGDGRGLSFLQWHELEYDAAGWPRLGARHVPKLRL